MLAPLPDLAPTLAALVLAATAPIAPLEVETDPALAFLASQTSAKGRRAQASALGLVAAVFGSTLDALPWHALRYPHVAALRAHLAERLAPRDGQSLSRRPTLRKTLVIGLPATVDPQWMPYHRTFFPGRPPFLPRGLGSFSASTSK